MRHVLPRRYVAVAGDAACTRVHNAARSSYQEIMTTMINDRDDRNDAEQTRRRDLIFSARIRKCMRISVFANKVIVCISRKIARLKKSFAPGS